MKKAVYLAVCLVLLCTGCRRAVPAQVVAEEPADTGIIWYTAPPKAQTETQTLPAPQTQAQTTAATTRTTAAQTTGEETTTSTTKKKKQSTTSQSTVQTTTTAHHTTVVTVVEVIHVPGEPPQPQPELPQPTQPPAPVEASTEAPTAVQGLTDAADLLFTAPDTGISVALDTSVHSVLPDAGACETYADGMTLPDGTASTAYEFPDYILRTYPRDGDEIIYNITVKTPAAPTARGVAVGQTAAEAQAAYGTGFRIGDVLTYALDDRMSLQFTMSGETITQIQYVLAVEG